MLLPTVRIYCVVQKHGAHSTLFFPAKLIPCLCFSGAIENVSDYRSKVSFSKCGREVMTFAFRGRLLVVDSRGYIRPLVYSLKFSCKFYL